MTNDAIKNEKFTGTYFLEFENLNLYIEIIPYQKLVNDAGKRYQLLFDKMKSIKI